MKLCTVTGSRAEFFILKRLILKFQNYKFFNHKLIITGSHTSKFFGKTINDIKREGIKIHSVINLNFKGDKPEDITNYFATGIKKFSKNFFKLKPDLILVLGDRYEIYSATLAAYFLKIPVAHLYGGEITKGSLDNGIRHSITKLSDLHFVSTKKYFENIYSWGENKKNIFNIGSLGVESLKNHKIIKKEILEKKLKIKFNKKNILMTFQPETINTKKENLRKLDILLNCIKNLKNTSIIMTMPGADHYYKSIQSKLLEFCRRNKNVFLFKSLGHDNYFSICRLVDFMIGNSSSGVIEMPSFKKGTINLGIRQLGRLHSNTVINADFNKKAIIKAINKIYSKKFRKSLQKAKNPYEQKNSLSKILKILKSINLSDLNKRYAIS